MKMRVSRCLRTQKYCNFTENEGFQVQKASALGKKRAHWRKSACTNAFFIGFYIGFSDFSTSANLRKSAAKC